MVSSITKLPFVHVKIVSQLLDILSIFTTLVMPPTTCVPIHLYIPQWIKKRLGGKKLIRTANELCKDPSGWALCVYYKYRCAVRIP